MKKLSLIIIIVFLLSSCTASYEMVVDENSFSHLGYTLEHEDSIFSSEGEGALEESAGLFEKSTLEADVEADNSSVQENSQSLSDYLNEESAQWLINNDFEIEADKFLLIDTQRSIYWDDSIGETVHNTFYLFFCAFTDSTHSSSNSFLLVESESGSCKKQLPKVLDYCIFGMTMYIHDVDGDKQEDVIIHQAVDAFGGAGQYRTMAYKVTDSELKELFKSPSDSELFDTGFRSKFLEGYKFQINNLYTGYSETFGFRNYRSKEVYWDENGRPYTPDTSDESLLWVDSFYNFCPKDVDGDGVFEFECEQYSCLYGHSDYIGDAKTVLKYNAKTLAFEVVSAEFKLYYELDTKYDRNITE